MKTFKQKMEDFFAEWTRFQFRHPKMGLLVWILFFALLVSNLRFITIDTSTEGFFHSDDPVLLQYEQFRDDHGRDELIVLAIESDHIFSIDFLKKLETLHEDLEENVPYLEEVNSLATARVTYGDEDSLIVEDLLEDFPETEEDIALARKRVVENPMYVNMLISEDGRITTLTIKSSAHQPLEESDDGDFIIGEEQELLPLTDAQNHELIGVIQTIADKYNSEDFKIRIAGSPMVTDTLKDTLQNNMQRFIGAALACITLLLFLLMRRLSGVILPLIVVIISLLSTVGAMGFFGLSVKVPTQILPSFLLAVGIGASVHILSLFFMEMQDGKSKEDAMVAAMAHSASPVLMTSITTAVGLLSFSTAEVAPIADLGKFAALGVVFCLLATLGLMPSLVALAPIKEGKLVQQTNRGVLDAFLRKVAQFSINYPKPIVLVSLFVFAFFAVGTSKIQFAHNPVSWLPENQMIRTASDWMDRELKGSLVLEFLIDSGKENGFYEPEMLNHLDAISDYAKAYTHEGQEQAFVGNVISIAGMLKEIHKALNANQAEYYRIPQDPELIPQEFFLFENSGADDLEDVIDSRFQIARFTVKVPWDNAANYIQFINDMEAQFTEKFGSEVQLTTTGLLYLLAVSIDLMMNSTQISYLIAGVIITFLMILVLQSWKMGLLSMFPNLFPLFVTIGMMGWVGIPMDMFSMLIGSIAIGLVVDDTIHFMHHYQRYFTKTGSAETAVVNTLTTTGRALLLTTLVLSAGFGVFIFSAMGNLFYFGLLTALTLIVALIGDLVIAPAMMVLLDRKKGNKAAGAVAA